MALTNRDVLDAEIAFVKMNLSTAEACEKEADKHRKRARQHLYHAWKLTGNVARVARLVGLSRPYVSQLITRARKENEMK